MARIFSGIQPSGIVHLGNYFGSIKNWLELQKEHECIFSIADLHAITIPQKPAELHENILKMAALYLASGIDSKKNILFVQSDVPAHAELCWILNTVTRMSELKLMHQFKEKSKGDMSTVTMGLFNYPVLMTADILLYTATLIPVGEDQQQHIELAREIVKRFNMRYGQTFVMPHAVLPKVGARIMGLDDPSRKMSKSAARTLNYIALTDSPDVVKKKIQRAVTDSGSDITFTSSKPALSNLLSIYHLLSGSSLQDIEEKYHGRGYGEFKRDLADVIIAFLEPLQKKYNEYRADDAELIHILRKGSERAATYANSTLASVKEKVGLGVGRS